MAQPAWPLVVAGNVGANLTAGFANLDNRLGELTKAVESRPPLGEPIEQILNVKIGVLVGPVQWHCWTVGPGQSLLEAAFLMAQKNVTAIFVQENQRIIGLVTRSQALAALESGKTEEPVSSFMVKSADVFGLRLSDTVATALDKFETHRVKRLVVKDARDRPVALLTSSQLLRWLGQKLRELSSVLST
jgi:predicted transcriptional regulator